MIIISHRWIFESLLMFILIFVVYLLPYSNPFFNICNHLLAWLRLLFQVRPSLPWNWLWNCRSKNSVSLFFGGDFCTDVWIGSQRGQTSCYRYVASVFSQFVPRHLCKRGETRSIFWFIRITIFFYVLWVCSQIHGITLIFRICSRTCGLS